MNLALEANFRVLVVSMMKVLSILIVARILTRLRPLNASCKSLVSLESRKGTCWVPLKPLAVVNRAMTVPNVSKDLFMYEPSLRLIQSQRNLL